MKKLLGLIVFIFTVNLLCFSQIVSPNRDIMEYEWRKVTERNSKVSEIVCDDCNLFQNFVPGDMFLHNGKTVSCMLNYNMFFNEVELIKGSDTLFVANRFQIDSIRVLDRTFLYTIYSHSKGSSSAFVEKLNNGKVKLLLYRKKTYVQETPNAAYTIKEEAHFKSESAYLIQIGEDQAFEIKSKKNILSKFSNSSNDIKKFMNENKFKIKREESLILLCNYLGTV